MSCPQQQFITNMHYEVTPLQLPLAKQSTHNNSSKYTMNSLINYKYSDTSRSEKFIPFEFRDKHISKKLSDNELNKQGNPFNSVLTKPFKNFEETAKTAFPNKTPFFTQLEESGQTIKNSSKKWFKKEINPDLPKLRQSNSTQCQSPKGLFFNFNSKLNKLTKLKLLGQGKFGDVYLVRDKQTGFMAALKTIKKEDLLTGTPQEQQKAINQITSQIKLQAYFNHPNLIQLYDFFCDEENIYLLLELACDGHLFTFLSKTQKFLEQTASIITREIVEGIDFMHTKGVIHRDIKLENIVLSHGMAKICDFGWSVYCPKQFRSTLCGTPLYLSPQILTGKLYNKKIDIWAIGSLTHELITGFDPFKIKTKQDLTRVVTQDFQMNEGSPELRSFLTFILRKNPTKRPDTDTLKKHPFIQKFKDLQTSEELCRLIYNS